MRNDEEEPNSSHSSKTKTYKRDSDEEKQSYVPASVSKPNTKTQELEAKPVSISMQNMTPDWDKDEDDGENRPLRRKRRRRPSDDDDEIDDDYEYVHVSRFKLLAVGEEALKYDIAAHRTESENATTEYESVAHLIKCCLGGGVLAMHEEYKHCGLWSALILNIMLAWGVVHGMHILVKSAHLAYGRTRVPAMSYPDLAEASLDIGPFDRLRRFSKLFRNIVNLIIMVDLFGSCCCYQVIIARSIKQMVDSYDAIDPKDEDVKIYIGCLALPCMLISLITTLKNLAAFSLIADFFIFILAFAAVYFSLRAIDTSPFEFPFVNSGLGMIEFISVCVFGMEGVGAVLAIENSMERPEKMFRVLNKSMLIVCAVVILVGFFGYWGFGEASTSPIIINFPWSGAAINLKVASILMVYITFAVNFWVPFDLLWVYLMKRHNPERFWVIERVYRVAVVLIITLVAGVFPNITKFMAVLGSICLSVMGFIFPAFIELSMIYEDPGLGRYNWRLMKFFMFLAFGLFLMIVGTHSNIVSLVNFLNPE